MAIAKQKKSEEGSMNCFQCGLEILLFQPAVIREDDDAYYHLHAGCVADFEADSPAGTCPLAEEQKKQDR